MSVTTASRAVAKLADLIRDIPIAMLTTVTADGSLRSRPMMTQETDDRGAIWFFTKAPSGKTEEVKAEEHVNLSYAAPEESRYVSVSGVARVVRDRAKARELWSPAAEPWFSGGVDDPELALLKVEPRSAEFWDCATGLFTPLVGFVEAAVAGEPYKPCEHGTIEMGETAR